MRFVVVLGLVVAGATAFGLSRHAQIDKPVTIPPAAPGASATAPRPIKENVVAFHTGDQAMIAAKQKARSTLPRFRQLMSNGTPGVYTIKFPLTQNGATEHIWLQLNGPTPSGDFVGRIANKPVNGASYKMGDRMTVAAANVEDWMIRSDGAIYGGYTSRVALSQMPKDQQEKLARLFKD